MTQYLIYFTVFMVVVLVTSALGARMTAGVAVKGAVNRRMKVLSSAGEGMRGLLEIRSERGLESDGSIARNFSKLRMLYLQSGTVIGFKKLLLYSALAGVAAGFLTTQLIGSQLVGAMVAAATMVSCPFVVLSQLRRMRMAAFSQHLPNAIDIIVRSLQAGHPLSTSLALVGSEMKDPIGTEFGILNDELTYGTEMSVALQNLMNRVPADDLNMFAMTIMIQRQTGGNLAEVLQTLSDTLRERQLLKLKIRSLTSEGRFSAVFMTIFPLLIYLMLISMVPNYFEPLWDTGYADLVFGACFVTVVIGNLVMRRMVNFKV